MAVKKKIPMRKCVGCGEMKMKKELMRILRTENGEFVVDAEGKKNGLSHRTHRRTQRKNFGICVNFIKFQFIFTEIKIP